MCNAHRVEAFYQFLGWGIFDQAPQKSHYVLPKLDSPTLQNKNGNHFNSISSPCLPLLAGFLPSQLRTGTAYFATVKSAFQSSLPLCRYHALFDDPRGEFQSQL